MPTTIDQYREAKHTFLKLRDQAKKDLLSRFQALSDELLEIQRELREDFGHKITVPTKPHTGKARKKVSTTEKVPLRATRTSKAVAIEKKIAQHKQKMEAAEKTGRVSQLLKDKLYELEDSLRLAREHS